MRLKFLCVMWPSVVVALGLGQGPPVSTCLKGSVLTLDRQGTSLLLRKVVASSIGAGLLWFVGPERLPAVRAA